MRYKVFLIIYSLSLCFLPCLRAQEGKLPGLVNIKSERNKTLIDVRLDSLLISDIMLDTGFSFDGLMIYNPGYFDSINITNPTRVTIGGAGDGDAPTALMFRSALDIGDITLDNHNILLLESDIYKGFPSNGIMGTSIFAHYIVEINYDESVMYLHNPDSFTPGPGWTVVPLYFKNNSIPWIDISIATGDEDPVEVSGYIDFAAGDELVLLERDNMKYQIPGKLENIHVGRGLRGDIYGKQGEIEEVKIGIYKIERIKVSVADAATRSKQQNADLIVGNGLLKKFNIIFDYFNFKLYLAPNKDFPAINLQR